MAQPRQRLLQAEGRVLQNNEIINMRQRYNPWIGDPRDPACPYDDDFTEEVDEDLYDMEVDKYIDERLMER